MYTRININIKRTVYFLLLIIFTLSGCNKKTEEEVEIYPFLRLGLQANESSKEYMAALKFAELVNSFSEGTVEIKIFPNGQFGDDKQMIQKVSTGILDITYADTGRLGLWVPEAQIFGYPFVFDNFEHLKRTLKTNFGENLHQKLLDKGIRVLATGYNGTRQTTSNKPINSLEDMKGMKLRVPNAEPNIKFAELLGATAVVLPFNEVYTYLEAKAIDGQENPLSTIDAKHFYEVQKYCAMTNHILNDNNFIISESSYQLLSHRQQEAVRKSAELAAKYLTKLFKEDEIKLIEHMKDSGMIFTYPDIKPFRDACMPLFYDYTKKFGDSAYHAILGARKIN